MPIVEAKIRVVFGKILLKKGSALLTALLVMGVLMSVSLALSALVLRESYTTREVLDAGRAYYGAESGVEVALYKIKHNLPGWETAEKGFESLKIDNEENVVTEYKVDNTCNAYPCFGADFEKTNVDLTAFYDILDLNESITIPLFVVGNDGKEQRVKDFTVEFYGIFNPNADLKVKLKDGFTLSGWDILRWKILGISAENKTESVSDFTALSTLTVGQNGTGKSDTDAARPSWFGSVSCQAGENKGGRYTDKIICTPYGDPKSQEVKEVKIGDDEAKTIVGNCSNTQAREHYIYVNGEVQSTASCFNISTFLSEHKLNYLTLTNMMNPSVFNDDVKDKIAMSKLYFRVELFGRDGEVIGGQWANSVYGNKTVREYSEIVSNGYSGNSKQSISVNLKRDSFMPVFNFSLYSTFKEKRNEKWEQ